MDQHSSYIKERRALEAQMERLWESMNIAKDEHYVERWREFVEHTWQPKLDEINKKWMPE